MKLTLPLKGIGTVPGIYLTQHFGEHLNDYSQFGMKGHNGVDWAAPLMTPIYAVHDGIIQFLTEETNYGTGYGKNIRMYFDEDGVTWDCIYGHLDHYEGLPRQVKQGDLIGYVDSTGFSTGNHLHFGIRKIINGAVVDYNNGYFGYIDPEPFFEPMTNTIFVHKAGTAEYGFYVPATSEDTIKDKALNFGLEITKSDGSVDFSKAKDINF